MEQRPQRKAPANRLGRLLTQILRHKATELGLHMRRDGFVRVDELLALPNVQAMGSPTVEQVRQIVAADEKTRYTLSEDDDVLWIRCNQGHSLKGVDQNHLLRRISDPDECPVAVHGTYWKSLGPIVSNGLNRMGRQHIHFLKDSPDLLLARHRPTAGIRSSCNVLIFVDVRKAIQEGFHFYVSDNGVILTEGPIASSYFIKVLELLPGDETRPISLEEVLGGQ